MDARLDKRFDAQNPNPANAKVAILYFHFTDTFGVQRAARLESARICVFRRQGMTVFTSRRWGLGEWDDIDGAINSTAFRHVFYFYITHMTSASETSFNAHNSVFNQVGGHQYNVNVHPPGQFTE
jgi:hypothetical protein